MDGASTYLLTIGFAGALPSAQDSLFLLSQQVVSCSLSSPVYISSPPGASPNSPLLVWVSVQKPFLVSPTQPLTSLYCYSLISYLSPALGGRLEGRALP